MLISQRSNDLLGKYAQEMNRSIVPIWSCGLLRTGRNVNCLVFSSVRVSTSIPKSSAPRASRIEAHSQFQPVARLLSILRPEK